MRLGHGDPHNGTTAVPRHILGPNQEAAPRYSVGMSYPKKIDHQAVMEAALALIEAQGEEGLSMRTLAAELGVSANALYRYYPTKADLSHALADEAGRLLLAQIQAETAGRTGLDTIASSCLAYLRFARSRPHLYAIKMRHSRRDGHEPASHQAVWAYVLGLVQGLQTPWPVDELAQGLWAYLHGLVELDRADLLEGRDAERTLQIGLSVFLAGLGQPLAVPPAAPAKEDSARQLRG